MRDKYRLGFVDVGGWDTHVSEGAGRGQLAGNLASLGRGLSAFAQTLGDEWNNTVVVVLSEFGRTFRENGNAAPITVTARCTGCSAGPCGAGPAGEQQGIERGTYSRIVIFRY